jgi:hypothetical protein
MLRVVIIKPSKYGVSGYVDRFRRGLMPNSTVPYIRSMTPDSLDGVPIQTYAIDEYVQTDLAYLDLLRSPGDLSWHWLESSRISFNEHST